MANEIMNEITRLPKRSESVIDRASPQVVVPIVKLRDLHNFEQRTQAYSNLLLRDEPSSSDYQTVNLKSKRDKDQTAY